MAWYRFDEYPIGRSRDEPDALVIGEYTGGTNEQGGQSRRSARNAKWVEKQARTAMRDESLQLDRRAFLASASALAGATLAGCSQLTSDEPLEFESTPARVPDDALAETGYEEADVTDIEVERTFNVGGQERTVTVTNWQGEYQRSLDIDVELAGDLSGTVFTTLTTPQIEILGQEVNPVADMSNEEILDRIQRRYDSLERVEVDAEESETILGETTTRTRFTADARVDGTTIETYLHVSNPVESNGDLVASASAHPRALPDEEARIVRMMRAIQHGE